jgi:hypothetical protein
MSGQMKKLLERLDEIEPHEVSKYSVLDPDDVKALGPAAALIELRGKEHWLPYSQLRSDDSQLAASNWILEQKGIEV